MVHELLILRDDEAEAHAGRDGFGEGPEQYAVGQLAGADVGEFFSFEAQLAVGIVLDEHRVISVEECADGLAALL